MKPAPQLAMDHGAADGLAMDSDDPAPEFAALYDSQFAFVWRLAARFGTPAPHREDVVQEVWLTAFRRRASLLQDASARAWLGTITRRIVARHHRTVARTARRHAAIEQASAALGEGAWELEGIGAAGRALDALEDDQRQVFLLSQVDGMSGPEIAEVLATPLNTVYSRLRLARLRLAKLLEDNGDDIGVALRRAQTEPPAAVRTRIRASLVMLPLPQVGLFAGGATLLKVVAAVTVSATTVFAIATKVDRTTPTEPVRSAVVSPVDRDAQFEPAMPNPATPFAAPVSSSTPPTPSIRRSSPPVARPSVRSPPTQDAALEAEMALLERIAGGLRNGDVEVALAGIREHAESFPQGRLAIERRAAEVRTLCLAGDIDGANARVAALLRDAPDAPAIAALGGGCKSR